jgi:hypothetical protein
MWCQGNENILIQGNIEILKKIKQWTNKKEKKKRMCQLTAVMICSLFWIS